jgi:hypothetical protein
MPRIDDYLNARKLAVEKLSKESFDVILKRSGFDSPDANTLRVPFLDRIYFIDYPHFEFKDSIYADQEVPIQEQVLILHYLMATAMPRPSGQWISYREIPGASFYYSAFVKRAIDPLKKAFGQHPFDFCKAAEKLQACKIESGDAGYEMRVLPGIPLQLILWEGDEEFPPDANILFERNIARILSPEDAAWLAGMVVYRLIAVSRRNQPA